MKRKSAGKVTLESLDLRLDGFEGMLGEIGETLGFVVERMATKDDLFKLHTQVNNIESDIRDMKNARLGIRVADLEEKMSGKAG